MPGPTHLKLTGSFNSSLSSSLLIRRLSKFNGDKQDLNSQIIWDDTFPSATSWPTNNYPRRRHHPTYYKRMRRSAGEWVNQIPNIESLLVMNPLHMRQTTVLCEGSRQDRETHLVQNSCEGFSLDTAFSSAFTCRGKSPKVSKKSRQTGSYWTVFQISYGTNERWIERMWPPCSCALWRRWLAAWRSRPFAWLAQPGCNHTDLITSCLHFFILCVCTSKNFVIAFCIKLAAWQTFGLCWRLALLLFGLATRTQAGIGVLEHNIRTIYRMRGKFRSNYLFGFSSALNCSY